jgi:hypothetical protein
MYWNGGHMPDSENSAQPLRSCWGTKKSLGQGGIQGPSARGFNTTSEYALYFTGSTLKNIMICLDGVNHDAVTPVANFNLRVRHVRLIL